ncbi:MAG: hypothetical protein IK102_06805 [Treponema sp.]|nr:hypothetical protein [Treponema sp.]
MKNLLTKLACIFAIAVLFTGCPKATGGNEVTDDSLTGRIDAAQTSIDFEGTEIAEDAVVAKKITVKNLKLGGKTLTIEASGTELQNVSNAVIVIDQKVGNGDVTLTGCSNITKLVVNGGGSNSIHIKNSKVASVEVKKDAVRVAMEGTSEVEAVVVDAANTKIESEEKIVIKSIEVAAGVDKVTVKGGTVEKIEIKSSEQSQNAAEVVIDGKANVQNIEGTTEVTLTEDAVDSGATVVIAANENVIPPTASFEGATITFADNGSVEGTSFENKDYFYEYIFDLVEEDPEISALELQLKIYKLADKILVYAYSSTIIPYTQTKSYCMGQSSTGSIEIEETYEVTFILKSAGLVLGEFTEDRPECSNIKLNKTFDVNDCNIPKTLVFPEDPYKPVIDVEATSDGNLITISNIIKGTNRVCVYTGEKDSEGDWLICKEPLFYSEKEIDTDNATVSFLDTYVEPTKEYIYYAYTNEYATYERFDTVTAIAGDGELPISAENTTNGIELTVPYIDQSNDYNIWCTIRRNYCDDEYLLINNYNFEKVSPIIDYFVQKDEVYKYELEYKFVYKDTETTYQPRSKVALIQATSGLGEPEIKSVEAAFDESTKIFTFTKLPELACTLPQDFTVSDIQIYYQYNIQSDNVGEFGIIHIGTSKSTWDLSNEGKHTFILDNYSGTINNTNSISYTFRYRPSSISGMPQTITIN